MADSKVVAFVGLGSMGFPMARNLAAAGFRLRLWNRSREKVERRLGELGDAALLASPQEAAQGAAFVVTSLSDDEAVRSVTYGPHGVLAGMEKGAVRLETTTVSAALSRELVARHAEAQREFVAAHVFGRPEAAEKKQLWVAAGGAPALLDRCAPLFTAIGKGTFRFDTAPQATLVKVTGNLMIASILEALGESLTLAEKGGVDPRKALEVLSAVFGSPVIQSYGAKVAEQSFRPAGFRAPLGLKDVRLALAEGKALGVPLPLGELLEAHLQEAISRGYGDADWSALTSAIREPAGRAPRA